MMTCPNPRLYRVRTIVMTAYGLYASFDLWRDAVLAQRYSTQRNAFFRLSDEEVTWLYQAFQYNDLPRFIEAVVLPTFEPLWCAED